MPPSTSPNFSLLPGGALTAPVVATINHLLAQESWARQELAPHAGKEAAIDAGSLVLRLRATADGMLEAGSANEAADVTIHLKLADLPLIAQNLERAFSFIRIEGDAELANTISLLAGHLRWEAEHDLEPWIGAIAANRLVAGARGAFGSAAATRDKMLENVVEFFVEERPLLVRPLALGEFSADVTRMRDDVERSAKRIEKLEQKLARRQAAPATSPAPSAQHTLDLE